MSYVTHQTPAPIAVPQKHRVLIAPFPPEQTRTSVEATKLCYALLLQGQPVQTVALPGHSIAQHKISFRARRRFERSLETLGTLLSPDKTEAIFFAGAAFNRVMDAEGVHQRQKELRRLIALCQQLLRSAERVILVGCAPWQRTLLRAACYSQPQNLTFVKTTDVRQQVLGTEDDLTHPLIDYTKAVEVVLDHASQKGSARPLSADRVADHMRALNIQSASLDEVIALCRRPDIRKHPRLGEILGDCPVNPLDDPNAILQKAMALEGGATRYMLHLRDTLGLDEKFPLTCPDRVSAFHRWYQIEAAQHVPSGWVPFRNAQKPSSLGTKRTWVHDALDGIPPTPETLEKWQLVLAILAGLSVQIGDPRHLLGHPEIVAWYERLHTQPPRAESIPEVTLAGLSDGATGLGKNLFMSAQAFDHLNLRCQIYDLRQSVTPLHVPDQNAHPLKKPIVLHHVNADRVPMQMIAPKFATDTAMRHIGFLLWEFEAIPQAHRFGLDLLDEIWAPSTFVADAYRRVTDTPVHLVKKGLDLPDLPAKTPNTQFTCLTCFDFHSSVERKNPLAAVHAFQTAFPKRRFKGCRLIVKTTPMVKNHWGDPNNQMAQIRRIARWDRRISIVESYMDFTALLSMIKQADCLISPHRAEGFGYLPAYALNYGTPVITSDFGGVQDFCTADTAFPVPVDLMPVPDKHTIFPMEDAVWADASPDAIAAVLRKLYDDPERAATRRQNGQRLIATEYSITAQAQRYRDRLIAMGALDNVR